MHDYVYNGKRWFVLDTNHVCIQECVARMRVTILLLWLPCQTLTRLDLEHKEDFEDDQDAAEEVPIVLLHELLCAVITLCTGTSSDGTGFT